MVLFDEDPVGLITATTEQFKIAPDKECLVRISNGLRSIATTRQRRVEIRTTDLGDLSRKANGLKKQCDYNTVQHDGAKHAEEMVEMDNEKFRIAKAAQDAEVEGERLSGELAVLKMQLQTLEKEGVEGALRRGEEQQEQTIAKLNFFRTLPIDATQDPKTGDYIRAVVRNAGRGDVNVVDLDGSNRSASVANAVWQSL